MIGSQIGDERRSLTRNSSVYIDTSDSNLHSRLTLMKYESTKSSYNRDNILVVHAMIRTPSQKSHKKKDYDLFQISPIVQDMLSSMYTSFSLKSPSSSLAPRIPTKISPFPTVQLRLQLRSLVPFCTTFSSAFVASFVVVKVVRNLPAWSKNFEGRAAGDRFDLSLLLVGSTLVISC